ncbi:hypothetical protein OVA00_32025 [Ensifer sp. SL37]|nr:hypothetical protein [Ensifer sp. SL37]
MRQQTKPFIVERKPSRKPKPDAERPSIWGRLDADIIAQGLKDRWIRIRRPPPVVTAALKHEHHAAAFTSASGCNECRKLTARCA